MTIRYVLVVAKVNDKVAVIKKNRPDWQKGRYNFIGGKIEKNEIAIEAAIREFKEETGVALDKSTMSFAGLLERHEVMSVTIYKTEDLSVLDVKTMTDEEIFLIDPKELTAENSIENLPWIYGLCFDGVNKTFTVNYD